MQNFRMLKFQHAHSLFEILDLNLRYRSRIRHSIDGIMYRGIYFKRKLVDISNQFSITKGYGERHVRTVYYQQHRKCITVCAS